MTEQQKLQAVTTLIDLVLGDYLACLVDDEEQDPLVVKQFIDGVRVVCKQYGIDPRQYDIDKLMSEVRNIELGV